LSTAISELAAQFPNLRDRWVAVAPLGALPPRQLHLLKSGEVVVDADPDLDVLCGRLRAAEATSLTIVYAGRR
jgi:hypothetical protein